MIVISAKTFRLSRKRSRGSTKKDLNLVSILVCVVVVFLFCNIPRVIINCYEFLCSENIVRWALFKSWHIKMLKQHILQWGFINCLDWLDMVLHQLQPPRPGVQRLRQLPHLLFLRQCLQADPPQACQSAAVLLTLRTAEWKFDKVTRTRILRRWPSSAISSSTPSSSQSGSCAALRSWINIIHINEHIDKYNQFCPVFFIGPESDHCLPLSLTDSLTR